VAAPRNPAISATIISAWPGSARSCSGSAPRPGPCCRKWRPGCICPSSSSATRVFPLTRVCLPTFTEGGLRLLRRLTLVVRHGVIETVFYPIFPPDPEHGAGNRPAGEPTDRVTALRRLSGGQVKLAFDRQSSTHGT
jgi:hypothetical protein